MFTINVNSIICDPTKRHDILLLVDCTDGNPNGNPDGENFPRFDPQTMEGLITDVCIKRKIRNVLAVDYATDNHRQIFIKVKGILTNEQQKAYDEAAKEEKIVQKDVKTRARAWMCEHYIDIRLFGAVMAGKQVALPAIRGPIQFQFARSIDPILPVDHSIFRVARTNPDEKPKTERNMEETAIAEIAATIEADEMDIEESATEVEHGTFGRKPMIAYGLYQMKGYYTPHYAKDTGVTREDLKVFWESMMRMFLIDKAASRGDMNVRGLYVFTHEDEQGYGNAHSYELFNQIRIDKLTDVKYPRKFEDYLVMAKHDETKYKGVTLTKVIG